MNRALLFAGGMLNLALAAFKIAMPYLFQWRNLLASSPPSMWSTLFAENLAISMLMLFFAWMSLFQWQQLLSTGLGKTVMLSIGVLFIFRAAVELLVYKIGADGAWWRVLLFLVIALVYLIPLIATWQVSAAWLKPRSVH
ncbi:MAG: hypothetical protein ACM3H7_08715 [Acidobacteriaceae bacterium]